MLKQDPKYQNARILQRAFSVFTNNVTGISLAAILQPFVRPCFQPFIKKGRKWSERQDSNLRPSGPKPDALPGCATLRLPKA